ncbi:MAG: hypothetical protein AAB553_02715 [Patescibacteria group bacterium]
MPEKLRFIKGLEKSLDRIRQAEAPRGITIFSRGLLAITGAGAMLTEDGALDLAGASVVALSTVNTSQKTKLASGLFLVAAGIVEKNASSVTAGIAVAGQTVGDKIRNLQGRK